MTKKGSLIAFYLYFRLGKLTFKKSEYASPYQYLKTNLQFSNQKCEDYLVINNKFDNIQYRDGIIFENKITELLQNHDYQTTNMKNIKYLAYTQNIYKLKAQANKTYNI